MLCWQLGYSHPDELSKHLTHRQILEWVAWLSREPRGDKRADALMAILACRIRECFRSSDSKQESPEDLLPIWRPDRQPKRSEADELLASFGTTQQITLS